MADWFGSVQATDEEAEILRKQVLEAFGGSEHSKRSDHSRNSPKSQTKLWEYKGPDYVHSPSRKSPVLFKNGGVASSEPLATGIGLDFLKQGANAAEAAIAVSAALCVVEPNQCGLGGDMFCLYYDASQKQVFCVNGSGKSPMNLSLEKLRQDCPNYPQDFQFSAHAVTVPGCAQGWEDLLKRHGSGKFTLAELVEPAAQLAEEGFPVAPVASYNWRNGHDKIARWYTKDEREAKQIPLTKDGINPPDPGDIFKNPHLARVLRELGQKGAQQGFYQGTTGQAIVDEVQKHGGCLCMEDLANVESTFPDPISIQYKNVRLWEVPPNTQGIAALIALKGLEALQENDNDNVPKLGSADYYHRMIEMVRLGFADNKAHVGDLDCMKVSTEQLLDTERLQKRAKNLFDPHKASIQGAPDPSSCTVSFQTVDKQGNAISFVNSNFMGFGTGIVPKNCGFSLQNRGFGFALNETPDHPNIYAPSKRPYHTILPGILTHANSNELYATISNMGGNMQPQGHVQLTVGMIDGGLDPQAAIDFPRFCIADATQSGNVHTEKEISQSVVRELVLKGHVVQPNIDGHARGIFGKAQIIKKDPDTGVWWAGSDGRCDGCAMGY